MQEAMADKARALNLLGADRDPFNSADGDAFLDLIDKYLDDPDGMPHPSSKPFMILLQHTAIEQILNKNHCNLYILSTVDLDDSVAAHLASFLQR